MSGLLSSICAWHTEDFDECPHHQYGTWVVVMSLIVKVTNGETNKAASVEGYQSTLDVLKMGLTYGEQKIVK